MQCSTKQLKVGHFLEEKIPDFFCKMLLFPAIKALLIPSCFLAWFDGECPETIRLKTSTGCFSDVELKQQDDNIVMDAGWSGFVQAHDLKSGYFIVFKKLDTRSLNVLAFGYDWCEKVIGCAGYHPSLDEQYESYLY